MSTTTLDPTPQASTSHVKSLWTAVGVLAVAVAGLTGTLIYTQTRTPPATATPAVAQVATPTEAQVAAPAVTASAPTIAKAPTESPTSEVAPPKPVAKPVPVSKPRVVHKPAPAPVATATGDGTIQQASKQVNCANCGTIESVTPIERKGEGTGVGAVAGGVIGGVLGNQVGGGTGRSVATVLGAVGGGFAGNAIEKNMRKTTVYRVRVRMEDGSVRTLEQATAPTAGMRVLVDGNTLRPQ